RVMHRDASAEPARKLRRDEGGNRALAYPAREAAGNEERLLARRDAERLERVRNDADRARAWVSDRARRREERSLDDDRRALRSARELLERRPLERKAKRLARRSLRIARAAGRRRAKDDRIVGSSRDHESRAGEERDPLHSGILRVS